MEKAMYSVIIPTLNEEHFLPLLLHSLSQQKLEQVEVIVVDGGSKDKTIALARAFTKKLPKLSIINSPKASVSYQRNLGARMAHGEWLVFVDADSLLLPGFFVSINAFIKAEHPKFFTTWCKPDKNTNVDAMLALLVNLIVEGSIKVKKPAAMGPMMAVAREAFEAVGGFDEKVTWGEDNDLSQRLYKAGIPLHVLRETLYVHSMRRFHKEKKIQIVRIYLKVLVKFLFTGKTPTRIPGYVMGGGWYGKEEKS